MHNAIAARGNNVAGCAACMMPVPRIEQDADVVLFVHREEYYHRGEDRDQLSGQAQIIIAKQRNGPVGEVNLEWLRDFTRFQDPVPERLKDFLGSQITVDR